MVKDTHSCCAAPACSLVCCRATQRKDITCIHVKSDTCIPHSNETAAAHTPKGAKPRSAEREAPACALQGQAEEGDAHAEKFAALMVTSLQLYKEQWDSIREKAGMEPVKGGSFLSHLGKPDGDTCKDYHEKCPSWADVVSEAVGSSFALAVAHS